MPDQAEPPRISISEETVKALIAEQFPQWGELDITPITPGGWDNRSFRLGDDKLVRLPSAERYAFQVKREQQWLPHLSRYLPLTIPKPLALGQPSTNYPWHWSVLTWIAGDVPRREDIYDREDIARDLALFLKALHDVPIADAPHTQPFGRGASPRLYDEEARGALEALTDHIDGARSEAVWQDAITSDWQGDPVWVHGDISLGNMLMCDNRLAAIIDFGNMVAGDPSCDLVAAWTIFRAEARMVFQQTLALDKHSWDRAKGWALWKALITLRDCDDKAGVEAMVQKEIIAQICESN